MSTTQADVRNLILKNMGVIAAGETASAEDAADVDQMLGLVHATLRERDIAIWDLSAVPDEVVMPLVQYVSGIMRSTDFAAPEKLQTLTQDMVIGLEELFRLTSVKASSEPVKSEYF